MAQGRRPKPAEIKRVQGNAGKRALPDKSLKIAYKNDLKPCDFLDKIGKKAFKDLVNLLGNESQVKVLADTDRLALTMLSDAYAEYRAAREYVLKNGQIMEKETTTGAVVDVPRPQVAIAQDAWKRVKSMLVEFGLTPSSRGNVLTQKAGEDDPLQALLKAKSSGRKN